MVRLKDCLLQTYQYHFINFNSTMVRLKERTSLYRWIANVYFNSTMVRLKVLTVVSTIRQLRFQFHYGTIKSDAHADRQVCHHDFNSTMVRLKVFARYLLVQKHLYFNSTMVRLKECHMLV